MKSPEVSSEVVTDDVFTEVDKLLEGSDDDKEQAYEILQRNKGNVSVTLEQETDYMY